MSELFGFVKPFLQIFLSACAGQAEVGSDARLRTAPHAEREVAMPQSAR